MMRWGSAAVLLVSLVPAARAQLQLRPGEYEVTLEMERAVARDALHDAGFNKEKTRDCFTADELKGPTDVAKLFALEAEAAKCTMSDLKTAGNKMTFTTTCEKEARQTVLNTEMTFRPDSVAIVVKERDDKGATSTIRITAGRIGDCNP
jgi:hypothetical protein